MSLIIPLVKYRNALLSVVYRYVLKPWFFINDPETTHNRMIRLGHFLGQSVITKKLATLLFDYKHLSLQQTLLGITFKNPLGLAAGFDKNGELVDILPNIGFGFAEIGSVTGYPCGGNPKPRLWRLKQSRGLLVYFGLYNKGCDFVAQDLVGRSFDMPLGTSIAMTNCIANLKLREAVKDYAKAFKAFVTIGDYFTINISCPNAQGGQPFTMPHRLDYLLDIIDEIPTDKPIFLKLSPDLELVQIDELLTVAGKHRIHGIICSNLTKNRDNLKPLDYNLPTVGGISGKPVQDLADRLLAHVYRRAGDRFVLIGCGGVFTAADAYRKIRLGASLVQLVTGLVYEGPQVISEINRGLAQCLKRDGFRTVTEAIGIDNR